MFNLVNLLALLGLVGALVAVVDAFKKGENWKAIILIVVSLGILLVTMLKNGADKAAAVTQNQNMDSLKAKIDSLQSLNKSANDKLVTIGSYVKKLDSMGIRRDSLNNSPIVTKQFVNYINNVGTLNQN